LILLLVGCPSAPNAANPVCGPEVCNGVDDDCDGDIDDAPEQGCDPLCSEGTGFECIDGSCGDSGQGGSGGSGPAPEPPAIRVGGGLCSAASGLTRGDGSRERHLVWLTLAAGLAVWCGRRRKR
jgi:hypothetical protein